MEEDYPHISWSPCTAHVLDLCLADFGRMPVFKTVIENGKKLLQFIVNRQIPYAIFKVFSKGASLVKYGATR